MVRPFEDLPIVMRKRAKELSDGVTKAVQRVATVVDREVVLGTPVDKGPARSNWVGTLNSPFKGVIPAYAPGKKLGLGEQANAEAAIAQGARAIRLFNVLRDKSLHFTNNVGYIGDLNDGSSAQAPKMFVQKAIIKGLIALKGVKVFKTFSVFRD